MHWSRVWSYTDHVSRGSAGEYQADEQAGVARLSWRVSWVVCCFVIELYKLLTFQFLSLRFLNCTCKDQMRECVWKCSMKLFAPYEFFDTWFYSNFIAKSLKFTEVKATPPIRNKQEFELGLIPNLWSFFFFLNMLPHLTHWSCYCDNFFHHACWKVLTLISSFLWHFTGLSFSSP